MLSRLIFAISLAAASYALDLSQLKATGHVNDFANVIDPASEGRLERYAREIKEKTGAEMAFVTLRSLDGEPIDDVANTLYRQWGIGQKSSNEGVLFLLSIRDRKSRMEVGYGLEPVLPDGAAGSVLRAMRPALRENHYGDAFLVAGQEIGKRILDAKKIAESARPAAPAPAVYRPPALLTSLWPMLLFLLVLFVLVKMGSGRSRGRSRGYSSLPWMIGGPGPWYGGGSHGGFGGSDSGGGFGGFGGGDSGGGGASSDW